MKRRVVGLGAGGHAQGVVEILNGSRNFRLVGLLDPARGLKGRFVLGVKVLGDDSLLRDLWKGGVRHFVNGIGGARDSFLRKRLYEMCVDRGLEPVPAIHASAVVSKASTRGRGLIVLAGGLVNAAALGENVLVNTGAVVEHDCVVGDHVHLATGSVLCGGVSVGEGSLVGAGAVVRQGIRIGKNVVVGAGAVVVDDVLDGAVVAGVPARPLKSRTHG